MSETKHFSYEATGQIQATTQGERPRIKDVVFLTPAKVTMETSGVDQEYVVSVDFVNRKVYFDNGDFSLSEEVFQYLDSVNSLPENLFEAPPEVVERAVEMQSEQGRIREQVGVMNG